MFQQKKKLNFFAQKKNRNTTPVFNNYLGRADGLTQLAGDAALFPCRVATQRVLSSEPGGSKGESKEK